MKALSIFVPRLELQLSSFLQILSVYQNVSVDIKAVEPLKFVLQLYINSFNSKLVISVIALAFQLQQLANCLV